MAWRVTADPRRFEEAIRWHLQRTVVTPDEAARLDEHSRQQAFWVGGGLQLAQIQRVFDELERAIAKGEELEDFKQRVKGLLDKPGHTEVVFRNAVQKAYNAGRYRQMRDGQRGRPYWRYVSVLDSRTTTICRKRDRVTLLASDPWWSSNWPPMHHSCRSTVRALTSAEAKRLGITRNPPRLPETPGWGKTPDNAPIWKPDPSKHDRALLNELEAKQTKPRKAKPKLNPAHSPAHWKKEYKHLGAAAGAAAYGRALVERGLDRSPTEIRQEIQRLKDAGFPGLEGFSYRGLEALDKGRAIRDSIWAQQNRGLVALTEHTRSIERGQALGITGAPSVATVQAQQFYQQTLDKSVKRPQGWRIEVEQGVRASASSAKKLIKLAPSDLAGTAVHEFAHAVEFSDGKALKRSIAFLRARTKGEKLSKLRDLDPTRPYSDTELGRGDKFLSVYMGKEYRFNRRQFATELLAMGWEYMTRPDHLSQLADRDPEMLYFLLGQLAGK